jgi:hypothetical protein
MAGIDLIDNASNVNDVQDQYQTGWWSRLTGGKTEKSSAIAMANVDRAFQAAEAQKNRDYQEMMSNSAYQRAVADMKAAGLNPAMLYSHGGSGASTPSGSSASGSRSVPPAASTGQLVSLIAGAVGSAIYAVKNVSVADKVIKAKKAYGIPIFKK